MYTWTPVASRAYFRPICRMETLEQFIPEFENRVGERVDAVFIGGRNPDDPKPQSMAVPISRDQALLMLRKKF